jgi:hypothetical protein
MRDMSFVRRAMAFVVFLGFAWFELPSAAAQQVLPVLYEEDRFFVVPATEGGQQLVLFTDTGGGLFMVSEAVDRLGLRVMGPEEIGERIGGDLPEETLREIGGRMVELPPFRADAGIPPVVTPWGESWLLPVLPEGEGPGPAFEGLFRDGMLGQAWFGGRVWTFDYPGRRLVLHHGDDPPTLEDGVRMDLGFQDDEEGNRRTNYPRMRITVDGEGLDMLFDTGATTVLTGPAVAALADGRAAVRATSFIAAGVFDRWRERNPEWRVIEEAEEGTGMAMIEAQGVVIAGDTLDAVWFTRRPDTNFHDWMFQWMDRRIEGAVGGNALRSFCVTVDYPGAVAVFRSRCENGSGEPPAQEPREGTRWGAGDE